MPAMSGDDPRAQDPLIKEYSLNCRVLNIIPLIKEYSLHCRGLNILI